ncbi:hypothetical protein [Novosphingobium rosa]|nr:hypothetical protein [Novosphingobium rosa]
MKAAPIPQVWTDLRLRHVWPVALVFLPMLAVLALSCAAIPFR